MVVAALTAEGIFAALQLAIRTNRSSVDTAHGYAADLVFGTSRLMMAPTMPYNMAFVSPIIDHTRNAVPPVERSPMAIEKIEGWSTARGIRLG